MLGGVWGGCEDEGGGVYGPGEGLQHLQGQHQTYWQQTMQGRIYIRFKVFLFSKVYLG